MDRFFHRFQHMRMCAIIVPVECCSASSESNTRTCHCNISLGIFNVASSLHVCQVDECVLESQKMTKAFGTHPESLHVITTVWSNMNCTVTELYHKFNLVKNYI